MTAKFKVGDSVAVTWKPFKIGTVTCMSAYYGSAYVCLDGISYLVDFFDMHKVESSTIERTPVAWKVIKTETTTTIVQTKPYQDIDCVIIPLYE